MDIGFTFDAVMWLLVVIGPIMFVKLYKDGDFAEFPFVKKVGGSLGLVALPIAFVLSKLLGDDFINSLPLLDWGALIFDAIDQWATIIFFAIGFASKGQYRAYCFTAGVVGLVYIALGYQYFNNLLTVIWGALDLSLGVMGVVRSKVFDTLNS